jgi:ubiquitin-like modifier-activating enzyme ATG7
MARAPSGSIPVNGIFKNFNTIEEFKATDLKKELFNQLTDSVSSSFHCTRPAYE